MEGHLGVSKHSPGTFEVIIILLALQQSGESTAERREQMTSGRRSHRTTGRSALVHIAAKPQNLPRYPPSRPIMHHFLIAATQIPLPHLTIPAYL